MQFCRQQNCIFFKNQIHTLIVYSLLIFSKFKYTIEIPASKVQANLKIHTLIVYPPKFRAFRDRQNSRSEKKICVNQTSDFDKVK